MDKIKIKILDQNNNPAGFMMFLAKLTQRGHKITDMEDLTKLYSECTTMHWDNAATIAALPHGTIKRFTPITIAIVGASRRFLSQIRTHQIGVNFVSASLQYSNYTGKYSFVVPYKFYKHNTARLQYLQACKDAMATYESLCEVVGNDNAGYVAPHGLRNILIMQATHQEWDHIVRLRACRRNTDETRYIMTCIWEMLYNSNDGKAMFKYAGPDCVHGKCKEGKMSCGNPMTNKTPRGVLLSDWPLITFI